MLANRSRENLVRNIEKSIRNPLGRSKVCYGGGAEELKNPSINKYEREQMLVSSGVWKGPPPGYQLNERDVRQSKVGQPNQKPGRPYLVDFARIPRETFRQTYVGSASTNGPGKYSRTMMHETYVHGNKDGEAEIRD